MNSVAQIAIGTVALGAAFIIGSQVRSQNAKPDVQSEQPDQEATDFVWQKPRYEPVAEQIGSEQGLIDMPEARKRVPAIPEPANLKLANLNAVQPEKQPTVPQQLSTSQPPGQPTIHKTIVEPDFSKLASSFFEMKENQTALQENKSESVAPLPRLLPPDLNLKSAPPAEKTTQPANNIVDQFDIAPRSSSFDSNDFEPQFKDSHPLAESTTGVDENQPPAPIEDNDNQDSLAMFKPVQSPQFARKIPLDAPEQFAPDQEVASEIPVLMSQQMTDATNTEMIEVRSRQTNGLRLETNRFIRHRSKEGETLQKVSRQYYGKPDFYLDIYLANQDVLRNPGRIPKGTSLRIPVYD